MSTLSMALQPIILTVLGGSWDILTTYKTGLVTLATIGVTYIRPAKDTIGGVIAQ